MGIDNFIQTAINNVLKNPILSILKQSNFIKRDIGKSPYLVIPEKLDKVLYLGTL